MTKKEIKLSKIGMAGQKHHDESKKLQNRATTEKDAFKKTKLIAKSEIEKAKYMLKKMEFNFTEKFE
ncbi:MAG: hypothetical protein COA32_09690 [Fluviicola sp.]|nr:MAG: hypothetical protein COA32_09690 [Fluviicola sp.]